MTFDSRRRRKFRPCLELLEDRFLLSAPVITAPANQIDTPGAATSVTLGSFTGGKGPWSVDVAWGDATADTKFTETAAGKLGTQSHTFASGVFTVKITVTDAAMQSGTAAFLIADTTANISVDSSGDLVIKDHLTKGTADKLTIQADTTNNQYVIANSATFSAFALVGTIPGATLSTNLQTADIPFADVTGTHIDIDKPVGTNSVTIDLSLGAFPSGIEIDYAGGSGKNTLIGPETTSTWTVTDADTGALTATGLSAAFSGVQTLRGRRTGTTDTNTLVGPAVATAWTLTAANSGSLKTKKVTFAFSGMQDLNGSGSANLLTGSNVANTWTISGADAGSITSGVAFTDMQSLTGGSKDDSFLFDAGASISGKVDGGAGSNTLTGSDAAETWNLTGPNAGDIPNIVTFVNMQNLTGGDAGNSFHFDPAASFSGAIVGGTGTNWLDYSACSTSVVVNLATGAASHVGGKVSDINNVLGSAVGGDTLTGDSAGGVLVGHGTHNTLTAGAGRSVLIGGFGVNYLNGGAADDLLINGRTSYDDSETALATILATWAGTQTYAQRVAALQAAGSTQLEIGSTVFVSNGLNGGIGPRFGYGVFVYESHLIGNGGSNWFITNVSDTVFDSTPEETVTLK